VGSVINEAGDATMVFANVHMGEDTNPLEKGFEVRRGVEALLAKETAATGVHFELAGDCIQDTVFAEYAMRDAQVLMPAFLMAVILVLSIWYRRPAGVLLPIGLVMLAVVNTMGVGGLFGAQLNNMTIAVPQIVLAACVGDLNHVFNGFVDRIRHGAERRQAVIDTIVYEFVPCFWTASTTAIGFFSMMLTTDVAPIRTLGWMGGVASMAAWFGTFTVMPCILTYLPVRPADRRPEPSAATAGKVSFFDRLDAAMVALSGYVGRTAGTLVFMAVVVIGVAVLGFTRVKFDSKSVELFAEDAPFRRAYNFIDRNITGPIGATVVVDTGEPGGVRKVKHLETLSRIHAHLEGDPLVRSATGLDGILKGMNRAMNGDLDERYAVASSDDAASAYYNAYTFSLRAGLELNNRVSADESKTLIDVRLADVSATKLVQWGHALEAWAQTQTPGTKVQVTGKLWLYSNSLTSAAENFFSDIGQAVFTISITLFFLARGLRLGLISMIVNFLPLFITVGFASLLGFDMDLSVLVSCSIAMGIVVDDTIHYVAKYKRLLEDHGFTHAEATAELAKEHSKASVATMLVLVGGFAMFLFTDYQINRNLGMTVATILTVGISFDLLVLPAMLKIWGPARNGPIAPRRTDDGPGAHAA
jgi:hypothetical protein